MHRLQDPRRDQGKAGARLIREDQPQQAAAPYRGRFAPSPTGPLHFGSLLAALASYLDARHAGGTWLLRIEDLDPPREMPGASDAIRHCLEKHGLLWDESVLYQSQRLGAYDAALASLARSGRVFPCSCTRAVLGPGGSCGRRCAPDRGEAHSLRFALEASAARDDFILGRQGPAPAAGDVVLRRRDGLHAYTLAVVVDDAHQGITHVLRGSDLLAQTATQEQLFEALGEAAPAYGHIPLVYNDEGKKLSKQSGAEALDDTRPLDNLRAALRFLRQPGAEADVDTPRDLLREACATWTRRPLAHPAGSAAVASS